MSALVWGAVAERGPEDELLMSMLAAIANPADDWGFACPSVEDLARAIRRDKATVLRRIAKLEADGWLRVLRNITRGGRGSVYFINVGRLGIEPHAQRRRSPLWAEISQLIKTAETTAGRPRGHRRLPFGKPDLLERAASGDLFSDDGGPNDPGGFAIGGESTATRGDPVERGGKAVEELRKRDATCQVTGRKEGSRGFSKNVTENVTNSSRKSSGSKAPSGPVTTTARAGDQDQGNSNRKGLLGSPRGLGDAELDGMLERVAAGMEMPE